MDAASGGTFRDLSLSQMFVALFALVAEFEFRLTQSSQQDDNSSEDEEPSYSASCTNPFLIILRPVGHLVGPGWSRERSPPR